jgi:hypothetical protein
MYAAVRQYEIGAGFVEDLMRTVGDGFADRLSSSPGFVSYHAIASGSDELVTISIFQDEASAIRSNELAAEFVREHLAAFQLNLTAHMSGEVGVART